MGALIGGGVGFLIANADEGPIFIASDQPITTVQVREKLTNDGWLNIQIEQQGRYFTATGTKDGSSRKLMIDSLTGQLIADEDDD